MSGHLTQMDDNADAKKILTASPMKEWKRSPGYPRITWTKTVLDDLKSHNLTLTEAVETTQSRTLEASGYEWHYTLLWCTRNEDHRR